MSSFRAIIAKELEGSIKVDFADVPRDDLPDNGVTVNVKYSSLNFKDGLALHGNRGKVMRNFPMVPGIDFSGVVIDSKTTNFKPGDEVLVTGCGIGEKTWGGFSEYASVDPKHIIKVPKNIGLQRSMAIGTAGFTSMLCIIALENMNIEKQNKPILITGASGGVGSISVAILSNLGYQISASTGREENHKFLRELGATDIIGRETFSRESKPIESSSWSGAIDTVGGKTLATVISQIVPKGSIACCGNVGGIDLHTSVLPLILRGINILGIDSVNCDYSLRELVWSRLSSDLPFERLELITEEIPFSNLLNNYKKIIEGSVKGRLVININE